MTDAKRRWALIVHGGARSIAVHKAGANLSGCRDAVEAGAAILRRGGSALEAAEAAVRCLEDDPIFNAGQGSVPNADGVVEMDAAIMDGATLDVGAVAAVRGIRNPIEAAVQLLREQPVLLVGEGAERFASGRGVALRVGEAMVIPDPRGREAGHDTVGCVAFDLAGHIAAAASTGGLAGQRAGRVGDAPIPGAGLYADDRLGGVALSGDGESILRTMLAARVMQCLDSGTAPTAAQTALEWLGRVGGEAGAIVIDRAGRFGVAHNSEHFAIALHASELPAARAAIHRDDLRDVLGHG